MSASEFLVLREARDILNLDGLLASDDFWEKGLDSLGAVEFLTRLEGITKHELDLDDLVRFPTVSSLAMSLGGPNIDESGQLFIKGREGNPVLFAIPGIGGSAKDFVHLVKILKQNRSIRIFTDSSLAPKDLTVELESRRMAESILQLHEHDWINLLGYSGGGVLALETARILIDKGMQVNLVIIDAGIRDLSREANHGLFSSQLPKMKLSWAQLIIRKCQILFSLFWRKGISKGVSTIWQAISAKNYNFMFQRTMYALSVGRFPKGLSRYDFLMQSKVRLRENFQPQPLQCSSTYFSVETNSAFQDWREILPDLKLVKVEGDHHSMMLPPQVRGLALKIEAVLAEVDLVATKSF